MEIWIKQIRAFFNFQPWNANVREIQVRLLDIQLTIASLVGIVLYSMALIPAITHRLYGMAIAYTLFFFWLVIISIFRKIPYHLRTGSWLLILFSIGLINLNMNGLNVDAGLFLLSATIMAALLYGRREGFLLLSASSLALAIFAYLFVGMHRNLLLALAQSDPFLWIIGGLIFFILGFLLVLTVSSLLSGLNGILNHTTSLAVDLNIAHSKIANSENRFRSLIENSTDMIAILYEDGEIGYASPSVYKLLGYLPDEIIGSNVLSYLHPEDMAVTIAALTPGVPREAIGDPVEARILRKDGVWRTFEVNGFEMKENPVIRGTVVNCRDISDRKKVEMMLAAARENLEQQVVERTRELQTASARLHELVTHSPSVIYSTSVDENWGSIQVSDNVINLLGYQPDFFYNQIEFWKNHVHPDDFQQVIDAKNRGVNEPRVSTQYRFCHQDGQYRWIQDDMQLVSSREGKPLEFVGSWIDITQQVTSEQARQATQNRYRLLYETMRDAFVRTEMGGRIIEFNQAYLDLVGYSPVELTRLTYQDLTPSRWHEMEDDIVRNQIIPLGYSEIYEKEYIRKDGSIIQVDLRTGLTRDESGNPESMWAIVRDISGRKQSEASILTEKMELEKKVEDHTIKLIDSQEQLRRLTREIITTQEEERKLVSRELHDEAGQVFVILKHNLGIAMDEIPVQNKALKHRLTSALDMVDDGMEIMRAISHRLRPPGLEVGGINISLEDLCHEYSQGTGLKIKYSGEDLPGLSNEIAITLYRVVQESLTNIIKHAHANKAIIRLGHDKHHVKLSVLDNGMGIKNASREGTGLLGLQERVNLLGGQLTLTSQPDHGVKLQVKIPLEQDNEEFGKN